MESIKLQTIVYFILPSIDNPREVYLLRKNKPSEPTDGFLVGIGGNVEPNESIDECIARETKEELKKTNINLSNIQYKKRGILIREDKMREIHIYIALAPNRFNALNIENEGKARWYPIRYHQDNPGDFLINDLAFLDELFFTDSYFLLNVNKKGIIDKGPKREYIGRSIDGR